MRVAYVSPMPPNPSGIADYSALLVPVLAPLIDLEVFSEPTRGIGDGCDVVLYHIGNNPDVHDWIVEALRERPGIVVLHEYVLHHLIAGITIVRGEHEAYRRAMARDAGVVGRLLAHGIIDGIVPPVWETRPMDFPLCGEVLDHATGLIVHSQTVAEAARGRGYAGPIFRISHPAWPAPEVPAEPIVGGGVIFGAFGHLNTAKRVPQLVEAFARALAQQTDARLLLVGDASEELHVDGRLAELEANHPGCVIRMGYVDEERLWALLQACDVCICLRYPTMGETSGIAIRALSCGRPMIVSDVGWFAELDESVAVRVPVDEYEVETLASAMVALAGDEDRRTVMGVAARRMAAEDLAVTHVAEAYRRAIVDVAGGSRVREVVLEEVATAAADAGLGTDSAELATIAERLREVRL